MKNTFAAPRLLCLLCLMMPSAPSAQSLEGVSDVALLPGWETPQGAQMAGLEITLSSGWHTYWRAPGDAGIPPQFDWSQSDNLRAVRIHWPRPEVFELSGMRTLGYEDKMVLPIEFFAKDDSKPIAVTGQMALGVCKDICIPVTLDVTATLGASSPTAANKSMIQASLDQRPKSANQAGAGQVVCTTDTIADGLKISAKIPIKSQGGDEIVVIEAGRNDIWVSQTQTTRKGNTLMASAEMVPPEAKPFALNRSQVRFTVLGDNGAVDLFGCVGG